LDEFVVSGAFIVTNSGKNIADGAVAIKSGRIADVGERESVLREWRGAEVIEVPGRVLMPGLINCHYHTGLTFLRGVAAASDFEAWMDDYVAPLEASLDEEASYAAALLSCWEMVRSGTTCFADMHLNVEAVARAVEEVGIRGYLSQTIADSYHFKGMDTLKVNELFVRRWRRKRGLVHPMFGPCAIRLTSKRLMLESAALANEYDSGIHTHLSENLNDVEYSLRNYGKRPTHFLGECGLLGNRTIAAHGVWLDDSERALLSRTGTTVVHNPTSNAFLRSGTARVRRLLDENVNVALGTDTAACNGNANTFAEMKQAFLSSMIQDSRETVQPSEVFRMATLGGAKALGLDAGRIERGAQADMVVLRPEPFMLPLEDRLWPFENEIVLSATPSNVETVIVAGRIVLRDGRLMTTDESAIIKRFSVSAQALLAKLK